MKKLLLFLLIIILQVSFAQIPQSFKYQAVVRDATGLLAVNKIVSIRTSILAGSATGSSVYTETQTLSTNDYGVVSLNIGAGTLVSGNFSTINWGATAYFVKTELDINGGSTYVFMGTSQVLSVPYALYSEKSESSFADHDTSATNELQNLSIAGKNLNITNGNTVTIPQDSLSIAGHILGITNGNTVNLPPPQTLSIVGDSLYISNSNAVYLSGSVDLDASPTNELQNLALNNDTLKISMGNQVVFPHNYDNDTTNELQSLSLNQGSLQLSKANTVHLPDSSATNELQTLSISNGTVAISNGNTIQLPDASSSNELQNLSVSNDSISITQGNTIYINTTRSLKFPEGIEGQPLFFLSGFVNYTVPTGKNLYILSCKDDAGIQNASNLYYYNGLGASPMSRGLPVIKEGETINGGAIVSALLVNKISEIEIVQITLTNLISFTIPAGKTFYMKSYRIGPSINGASNSARFNSDTEVMIFPSGSVLSYPTGSTDGYIITGYYK